MGANATYRGTAAAVVQLLVVARNNGIVINRTKLAKLLYLADLQAVEEGRPPGSGVEWRWRHFGPYSNTLRDIEIDLETAKVVEVAKTWNFFGGPEKRLRLLEATPAVEIDAAFACIIEHVLVQHGHLSASQLRDLTYQTSPMLSAQAKGVREVRLDLAGGDPYPDLEPALARLRKVAESMPPCEDEPGGIQDLTAEISEWGPLRREVMTRLLDAE